MDVGPGNLSEESHLNRKHTFKSKSMNSHWEYGGETPGLSAEQARLLSLLA